MQNAAGLQSVFVATEDWSPAGALLQQCPTCLDSISTVEDLLHCGASGSLQRQRGTPGGTSGWLRQVCGRSGS